MLPPIINCVTYALMGPGEALPPQNFSYGRCRPRMRPTAAIRKYPWRACRAPNLPLSRRLRRPYRLYILRSRRLLGGLRSAVPRLAHMRDGRAVVPAPKLEVPPRARRRVERRHGQPPDGFE